MPTLTTRAVANLVKGDLFGNEHLALHDVAALPEAQAGHIAYIAGEPQLKKLPQSQAAAVLVPRSLLPRIPAETAVVRIAVDDAQAAFIQVMLTFRPQAGRTVSGVSPRAIVSPTAILGPDCNIHAGAVIGDGAVLGARCDIHAGAVIGEGCVLGDDVVVHPNAVLYHSVRVGQRVIIHATAVIGADGFGYRFEHGRFTHIPHTGTVHLEDDVEIGAGTTIDRAMIGTTLIGAGTKLDNQVMIAHNCVLGKHNVFAAQVGMAGSATTGDYVRCGGQVGIGDHAHLGTGCAIGAMAGASGIIPDGQRCQGIPARPERDAIKAQLAINRLPEMRITLRELAATVKALEAELATLKQTTAMRDAA